jgi:hypothetical protein
MNEINSLSFDDKIKVWLDYVVTQSCLNNIKDVLYVGENKYGLINTVDFPVLGCYWGLTHNIKILSFEEFTDLEKCSVKVDYGAVGIQTNYLGIYDWYPKFKTRIFKK